MRIADLVKRVPAHFLRDAPLLMKLDKYLPKAAYRKYMDTVRQTAGAMNHRQPQGRVRDRSGAVGAFHLHPRRG